MVQSVMMINSPVEKEQVFCSIMSAIGMLTVLMELMKLTVLMELMKLTVLKERMMLTVLMELMKLTALLHVLKPIRKTALSSANYQTVRELLASYILKRYIYSHLTVHYSPYSTSWWDWLQWRIAYNSTWLRYSPNFNRSGMYICLRSWSTQEWNLHDHIWLATSRSVMDLYIVLSRKMTIVLLPYHSLVQQSAMDWYKVVQVLKCTIFQIVIVPHLVWTFLKIDFI